MVYLADALSKKGYSVIYVAEEAISTERINLGWRVNGLDNIRIEIASSQKKAAEIVKLSNKNSVHFTQGLRANGNIKYAQRAIYKRRLRHYAILETIDDRGFVGLARRLLYAYLLFFWSKKMDGILAIGKNTGNWLNKVNIRRELLPMYSFAYFLRENVNTQSEDKKNNVFRFIFVGQLIKRKNLDILLEELAKVGSMNYELFIIGDGAERQELELKAWKLLPGRVIFLGVVNIDEVPGHVASADCLVLPSSHDGWGAVVGEALMVGTPVICSSTCGACEVVEASGVGGVFDVSDAQQLRRLLLDALASGSVTDSNRLAIRAWGKCVGVGAGAEYMEKIFLQDSSNSCPTLVPPWTTTQGLNRASRQNAPAVR